jgi:hypothetical protein
MENIHAQIACLEKYTRDRPEFVFLLKLEIEAELEEILIFKGFSSSLTRATNWDPDLPVVSSTAKMISIDRLLAPYDPDSPNYLEKGMNWEETIKILN